MSSRFVPKIVKSWAVAGLACLAIVQACGDDSGSKRSPQTTQVENDASPPQNQADGSTASCEPNVAECVNERVGRICPSDGSGFLSFECRTGETCQDGQCSGGCTAGTQECVSDDLARVCAADGEAWVAVPCGSTETCVSGRCTLAMTQACTPGAVECATSTARKTCDTDGSAWVVEVCAEGEICTDGVCERDLVGAECVPDTTLCLSSTTGLRCLPEGKGYEQFDCPTTAPCTDGLCRGPVCIVGASQCTFTGDREVLQTCVDGTSWAESVCASNQNCIETFSGQFETAQCRSQSCPFQGETVCGDPTNPTGSNATFYSQCTFTEDGLQWVRVDCPSPATCDPSTNRCSTECVPGEKRCSDLTSYQECGTDGQWLPAQSCTTGSTTLACEQIDGTLPDVRCVDEVCAFLSQSGISGGVCVGTEIQKCDANGFLSAVAEPCTEGICRIIDPAIVLDGKTPGQCSAECQAGESRCVRDGLPLYQTCVNGTWSSDYLTCDSVCTTVTASDGTLTKLCGNECLPGSTSCDGEKIRTCGTTGQWLTSETCTVGRCQTVSATSAVCQAECVPGWTVCVGAETTSSDGSSIGTTESAICTDRGLFPSTTTICPDGQTCRTSSTGVTVGCVECIGPDVPGGNDGGLADSRCATSTDLQVCSASNTWGSATNCGPDQSCFVGNTAECGGCFIFDKCTQSNLNNGPFPITCEDFGLGPATSCGGVPDCCAGACQGSSNTFAFCAPSGFSPCLGGSGATDLGSSVPQTITGTTFFSDDSFQPLCSFPGGADEVFTFTAPSSGTFGFDTFGSSFDTSLYALDALSCSETTCNDDTFGSQSKILIDLSAGQTVLIIVDGAGSTGGNFTLNVWDGSLGCSPAEFNCGGGQCLPQFFQCNGFFDCFNGSDETGCADAGPGPCGNGIVDPGEMCDGPNLNGETCSSATMGVQPNGTLACSPSCTFDTSGCSGGTLPEGGVGGTGF